MLKRIVMLSLLVLGSSYYNESNAEGSFGPPPPQNSSPDSDLGGFGPPSPPSGDAGGFGPPPPPSQAQNTWGQNQPPSNGPSQGSFGQPPEDANQGGSFGPPPSNQEPPNQGESSALGPQQQPQGWGGQTRNQQSPSGNWQQGSNPNPGKQGQREHRGREHPKQAAVAEGSSHPADMAKKLAEDVKKAWPQSSKSKVYEDIFDLALKVAVSTMDDYTSSGSHVAELIYSSTSQGLVIYPKEYRRAYILVRYIQAWLSPGKYSNKGEEDMSVQDSAIKSSVGSAYWDADIRRVVTGLYKEVLSSTLSKKLEQFLCSSEEIRKNAGQVIQKRCHISAPNSNRRGG